LIPTYKSTGRHNLEEQSLQRTWSSFKR
jgi:hypothetical protein